MNNSPIMNADPEGDLPWIMPHVSFDGGLRIGVTAGFGPVSGTLSYGKGGFGASVGLGVGPLSLSYGTGGFNANLGLGVNQGGLGLNFGGINYGSSGLGFNGPSVSYGHRFDFGSETYAEKGQLNGLDEPVEYNQANADYYAKLAYGDLPSYTKIISDGTLEPRLEGSTIDKNGYIVTDDGYNILRGSTIPDKRHGKTNSTIYLYKPAFTSRGQLISTIGHEFYHAKLFNAGIHNSFRHHASIAVWLARTHKTLGVGQRQSSLYWDQFRNNFNIGDLRYQPSLLLESLRP